MENTKRKEAKMLEEMMSMSTPKSVKERRSSKKKQYLWHMVKVIGLVAGLCMIAYYLYR